MPLFSATNPPSFGLITEGQSDQAVIEAILTGFFNRRDLQIEQLPLPDSEPTDETIAQMRERIMSGGWSLVLKACAGDILRDAPMFVDYIVIQIDTDVAGDENGYPVSKQHPTESRPRTVEELVIAVQEYLIEIITENHGEEWYEQMKERLIFAVAVHSIECWLLPIVYPNDRRKQGKVQGCFEALNRGNIPYRINKAEDSYTAFQEISKTYAKYGDLMNLYEHNPSLKLFVEGLEAKGIEIEEDDDW